MSGTPEQALATCRKLLARERAKRYGYVQAASNTAARGPRMAAERQIAKAEAEIGRLQAEERRLENEANVASLQSGLVASMPAPLVDAPTHRVPARYPEPQR